MDPKLFIRVSVNEYQTKLCDSAVSKEALKSELFHEYNKISERKNAKVNHCDYCGKKSQVSLNIGKDIKRLGWKDDAEFFQVYCCWKCAIPYMAKINYLLLDGVKSDK